ncbi:TetR/AcrR family transcriptional regulator [Actinokineospora soli]|uniref:TetR/AcrR family transcriptional regulator n=1 Tax=Actinokineospora soli TaxID=1048753 RepID=A0ABW2TNV7_9PSEU
MASTQTRWSQAEAADPADFRGRLLAALASSITEVGYRDTTVADIVRRAKTSRRTFYAHFASREECLIALIHDFNTRMIARIAAAVDGAAPWETQVRQAIHAWIAYSEEERALTLCWIRETAALGDSVRHLKRDTTESFAAMIQTLCDTAEWRAVSGGKTVSRQMAIILVGGLTELTATTVESGRPLTDIAEAAAQAAIVLLRTLPD